MPLYNVVFFTSTDELIERKFPADNMEECLNLSVDHFDSLNADHGELLEVVVLPPDGETFLDSTRNLEIYWVTPAGKRSIRRLR